MPTLRQKKRYILYEVISQKADQKLIAHAISVSAKECVGLWGTAKMNIHHMHKYYNPTKQQGILRVSHEYVDEARAVLGNVRTIGEQKAIVHTLQVSGSLKKLR